MNLQHSVAALFERDKRLFLAKRKPGGDMGGRWELPGGKVEAGETLVQALEREILEEFDLVCSVGAELGQAAFEHKGRPHRVHLFVAEIAGGNARLDAVQLREHVQVGWFSQQDLKALQATIVDSDWQLLAPLLK